MKHAIVRALEGGPVALTDLYERVCDATGSEGAGAAVAIARSIAELSERGLLRFEGSMVSLRRPTRGDE